METARTLKKISHCLDLNQHRNSADKVADNLACKACKLWKVWAKVISFYFSISKSKNKNNVVLIPNYALLHLTMSFKILNTF